MPATVPLLEVQNLRTEFKINGQSFAAVDDISFSVQPGQVLGIVGESGCGKSVTSLSILRLIQEPGSIAGGKILFKGQDLLSLKDQDMRKIRGKKVSMIFQEPMTALNPVYTIGNQMVETIRLHRPEMNPAQCREHAINLLKKVGIPAPEQRIDEYIHQLSGGMRQRVMIAISICADPELLIADEPTTALDVTIQAQILNLMKELTREMKMALVLITHDLGVVAEMCDQVAVMYAGQIVERGTADDIFYRPRHPYTRGLLDSIPHFESGQRLSRLKTIPGLVPSLTNLPKGCRFQERCTSVQDRCRSEKPMLQSSAPSAEHACFFPVAVVKEIQ